MTEDRKSLNTADGKQKNRRKSDISQDYTISAVFLFFN